MTRKRGKIDPKNGAYMIRLIAITAEEQKVIQQFSDANQMKGWKDALLPLMDEDASQRHEDSTIVYDVLVEVMRKYNPGLASFCTELEVSCLLKNLQRNTQGG